MAITFIPALLPCCDQWHWLRRGAVWPRQRRHARPHEAGRIGAGRIRTLLPFPELEGALDHDPAAVEAQLTEPRECDRRVALQSYEVGEHDRVLHAHRRPGGHVRRGRVERVADEDGSPAMPGKRYENRV